MPEINFDQPRANDVLHTAFHARGTFNAARIKGGPTGRPGLTAYLVEVSVVDPASPNTPVAGPYGAELTEPASGSVWKWAVGFPYVPEPAADVRLRIIAELFITEGRMFITSNNVPDLVIKAVGALGKSPARQVGKLKRAGARGSKTELTPRVTKGAKKKRPASKSSKTSK